MLLHSLLLILSTAALTTPIPQLGTGGAVSISKLQSTGDDAAPSRFVVQLRSKAKTRPTDLQKRVNNIDMTLDVGSWHGVAGRFNGQDLSYFNSHPDVQAIYPDYYMGGAALTLADIRKQVNPPYGGMVRISHRHADGYKDFIFPKTAGRGVTVYVLDTGVQYDVADFEGRVIHGVSTLPPAVTDPYWDDPFTDLEGHGTNCAGLIAGRVYGVAKKAYISAVKVLYANFTGTLSAVVKGIEFVEQQASETGEPSLMNLSLTSNARFDAFDLVVASTRVPIFAAAGNGVTAPELAGIIAPAGKPALVPYDACRVTPGGTPGVFAVAAIDNRDKPGYFSNYGRCVKLYAPGVEAFSDIPFAGATPPYPNNRTGTSQATAVVSGVAALYMSLCNATVPKRNLYFALLKYSTKNMVGNVAPGTPNRIAYVFPSADYFNWCFNPNANLTA